MRSLRPIKVPIGMLFICLVFGHTVSAQAYKQLSIGEKLKTPSGVRVFRTRKNNVLKGTESFAQVGEDMLTYYKQYLMPAMTREDQRSVWADLREEVVSDLADATDPKARTAVFRLVGKFCFAVVPDDRYDPVTRYNCMLLLGELNSREGSGNKAPVPFAALLPKLMEPFSDDKCLPMLRYAAILGIVRHAELGGHPQAAVPMAPQVKEDLVKLMIKVASDTSLPDGVDESSQNWLRAKAVETLGLLYVANEEVVNTLAAILVDEKAGFDVRCNAAEAVGRIAGQVDPSQVEDLAGRMAKLTYDCVQSEFMLLMKNSRSTNSDFPREGGRPPREGYSDPNDTAQRKKNTEIADARTIPTRRRLLFQLLPIQSGLSGNSRQGIVGLTKVSGAETHIAAIEQKVNQLIEKLQDVDAELPKIGHSVEVAFKEELLRIIPKKLLRSNSAKAGEESDDENSETAAVPIEQAAAASGAAPS